MNNDRKQADWDYWASFNISRDLPFVAISLQSAIFEKMLNMAIKIISRKLDLQGDGRSLSPVEKLDLQRQNA